KIKSIGLVVFFIGIVYMAVDGWLLSWWYVPDYRLAGPAFISDNSFYTSKAFFTFWALSVPLGSILTALGLALYSKLEKLRLIIFILISLVLLAWLGIWSQSVLYSVLYGIGGGLILFSFCTSICYLTKVRIQSKSSNRIILDFRALGYIFLLITAWGLCGLLGIPSFGLRSEHLLEYKSIHIMINMSVKVLVCFTLGWICLALSQYFEYRQLKESNGNI
ncbi:hypothetical protein ACFLSX_05595, partial [Calditrichota bacterium]